MRLTQTPGVELAQKLLDVGKALVVPGFVEQHPLDVPILADRMPHLRSRWVVTVALQQRRQPL